MDCQDIVMQTCDSNNTTPAFQRGTPVRRGIRLRKTNSQLPTNSRLLMKRVQSQQLYDQILSLPLDQVHDAIAPNAFEELNESFYIDEDDVSLIPTHRSSKRSFMGNFGATSKKSKVIRGKNPYVVRTKHLRTKVKKAFNAIDRFFSK